MLPAKTNFQGVRGATFRKRLTLYTDKAKTNLYNLTGYTVTVAVGKSLVLTNGSGVTVGGTAGTIEFVMTPSQTVAYNTERYSVKIQSPSGDVDFILSGTISFIAP